MSTHNAQVVDDIALAITAKGQFLKKAAGGVTLANTLGERTDGVAFSDAIVNQAVGVQIGQKIIVKVGVAAIADAAEVTTNALGLAITAVATNVVRCKSVEAGAAGGYMECLWVDAYVKP
ncbi:MAG: hypothetical protein M3R55_10230 [Acidobacteriota bacterium]|nr:hypothetical protein [Acidobacteriota bacterium]